jgi:hypothetical protein
MRRDFFSLIALVFLLIGSARATEQDLRSHVNYLCSDALGGRLTGSAGEKLATQYIATQFQKLGLVPAGDNGTYFQEFDFTAGIALGKNNFLVITNKKGVKRNLLLNKNWRPLSFSASGAFSNQQLVFAGEGITAPASKKRPAFDSYKNLSVKNKWVVVLRYSQEKISSERSQQLSPYATLRYKAFTAAQHGAIGIIFLSNSNELIPLTADLSNAGIMALSCNDKEILTANRITGQTDIYKITRRGRNVLAKLELTSSTAPIIVVGAHVDHLGHGELNGSLARADEKGMLHPGADDNASGVAAVIEAAVSLTHLKTQGLLRGNKNILFAAWSGEEVGILGSTHFVKNYLQSSSNKTLRPGIDVALNLDMVGHLKDKLVVQGTGSSTDWPELLKHSPIPLITQSDPYLPTDSTAFYLKGVPTLNLFTGASDAYHSPRDIPTTLNYQGIKNISEFLVGLILKLEDQPKLISFRSIKKTYAANVREYKIYLGTIPDYSSPDTQGVKLSGVAKNSPAEQAGLKQNDVIIMLAGRKIHDIYDYTYVLNALHAGQPVKLLVLRGESRVALTIVARYRE